MAIVGTVKIGVVADTSGLSRGMTRARGILDGFNTTAGNAAGGIGKLAKSSAFGALKFAAIGLAAATTVGAFLAVVAAAKAVARAVKAVVGALGKLIKASVLAAVEQEALETAFTTMLGSAERARETLAKLTAFSVSTPFEPDDVFRAGKALLAFGVEAQKLPAILRALGDVGSGLGIPLTEMADLFGRAKVQGRLFGQDIREFMGRGIPILQVMADRLGVTTSEVQKLVSEGKIGFPELQNAFRDMTSEGGKFQGQTENASKTLKGLWSTLAGEIQETQKVIGKAITEAFNLGEVIPAAIFFLRQFREKGVQYIETGLRLLPGLIMTAVDASVRFVAESFASVWTFITKRLQAVATASASIIETSAQGLHALGRGVEAHILNAIAASFRIKTSNMVTDAEAFQQTMSEIKVSDKLIKWWEDLKRAMNDAKTAGEEFTLDELPATADKILTAADKLKEVMEPARSQRLFEVESDASRMSQAQLPADMISSIEKNTKREAQNSEKQLEDERKLFRLLENRLSFETVRIA